MSLHVVRRIVIYQYVLHCGGGDESRRRIPKRLGSTRRDRSTKIQNSPSETRWAKAAHEAICEPYAAGMQTANLCD